MQCTPSVLSHPTGFIKIIEIIVGIICISLVGSGCYRNHDDMRLIFITTGAYLIITPCILVGDILFHEEDRKPHLAALLNSFAVVLYLSSASVTLVLTKGYYGSDSSCLSIAIALGVFAVFNTLAYAIDTIFTILRVYGHTIQ